MPVFDDPPSGGQGSRNAPGLSLAETFDAYVRAEEAADLEGLFSTVTSADDFFFLTADGKMLPGREDDMWKVMADICTPIRRFTSGNTSPEAE